MRLLVVLVGLAAGLGAGACSSKSSESSGSRSASPARLEIARTRARQLANQAYPQWLMEPGNADRCPTVEELGAYLNQRDLRDPWGQPFTIRCGADLPPGVTGIAVSSPGGDGRDGTSDDVRSWE